MPRNARSMRTLASQCGVFILHGKETRMTATVTGKLQPQRLAVKLKQLSLILIS